MSTWGTFYFAYILWDRGVEDADKERGQMKGFNKSQEK